MSLTYSRYLKLDELLDLQQPLSDGPDGPEHDETLFIVIHQVYELWFKQVLHELDHLAELLDGSAGHPDAGWRILATLRRILTILKTMVAQIDILETMNPISFGSFRSRLEAASGFQSPQFRELEFVLGLRHKAMLSHHRENKAAHERLRRRLGEPTLYQHFLAYLARLGHEIPAEVLAPYEYGEPPSSAVLRRTLIAIYRGDAHLTQLCERLVDFDEGLQEWRYRHVKMVERTIGGKPGTGKSAGVAFLKKTLFQPLFPDLWTIRTEL
jgi:tryptophan 2,3-dioxygenase